MLRRSAALDVGGYDPSTEPAEDYDLWLRLETAEPGSLANIGEVHFFILFLNVAFLPY